MMTFYESDAWSSILGWMSIACWIVVYSPQIYENFQLKSGEGLSVLFVLIWLAGDLCNLVGASLAGLLPTVIILAAYYTVCDVILLIQIYYYRWSNLHGPSTSLLVAEDAVHGHMPSEETPLIASGTDDRRSAKRAALVQAAKYGGALIFVLATGAAAWAVDQQLHREEVRTPSKEVFEWRSQLLGWISAVLYIGARIPQIVKNLETKCEGLSPALFLFSIAGNVTYVLSILVASMDLDHIAANAGWIAGSSLTVFLDIFVLGQFFFYQASNRSRLLAAGP